MKNNMCTLKGELTSLVETSRTIEAFYTIQGKRLTSRHTGRRLMLSPEDVRNGYNQTDQRHKRVPTRTRGNLDAAQDTDNLDFGVVSN